MQGRIVTLMATEPLITSDDLAAELHVPVRTLDQWAYRHTGPLFVKVGRHRRYRRTDVDAWLEAQTVRTRATA